MSKFKIGDVVECVNDLDHELILSVGEKYTVEDTEGGGFIKVLGRWWYITRFKLVEENKMQKQFTKNDLKTGMRVVHRNGKVGVVLNDIEIIYYPATESFNDISSFRDDLSAISQGAWDIIDVYEGYSDGWVMNAKELGVLLWKREGKSPEQIEAENITKEIESLKLHLEELSKKI